MAEPDSDDGSLRDAAEKLLLAAAGAVALTGDRAEALADELAERGAARRDEVSDAIKDVATRWRGDALRVGERAGSGLAGLFHDLGLVTRDDLDALELRVAQLEHRVRLLEERAPPAP
jgi:polyhydroxyalkanoate synthesis regulator phasin